jgi:hypothetical protein
MEAQKVSIEIFLDIETLPTSRADIQARCVADIGPPGNYKKPESIAQWWASEGDTKKQEALRQTALNGTWGEIICIGFAVNDNPSEVISRALTEADLLNTFGLMLDAQCRRVGNTGDMWPTVAMWIGHNVIDFDLRFLWQRSRVLGHNFPFELPVGKPDYRGPRIYDTMKEWAGWRDRISQSDLELAFGIERRDPLPNGGADVFQAYQDGRLEDIKEHCRQDIENLRQIYRRIAA